MGNKASGEKIRQQVSVDASDPDAQFLLEAPWPAWSSIGKGTWKGPKVLTDDAISGWKIPKYPIPVYVALPGFGTGLAYKFKTVNGVRVFAVTKVDPLRPTEIDTNKYAIAESLTDTEVGITKTALHPMHAIISAIFPDEKLVQITTDTQETYPLTIDELYESRAKEIVLARIAFYVQYPALLNNTLTFKVIKPPDHVVGYTQKDVQVKKILNDPSIQQKEYDRYKGKNPDMMKAYEDHRKNSEFMKGGVKKTKSSTPSSDDSDSDSDPSGDIEPGFSKDDSSLDAMSSNAKIATKYGGIPFRARPYASDSDSDDASDKEKDDPDSDDEKRGHHRIPIKSHEDGYIVPGAVKDKDPRVIVFDIDDTNTLKNIGCHCKANHKHASNMVMTRISCQYKLKAVEPEFKDGQLIGTRISKREAPKKTSNSTTVDPGHFDRHQIQAHERANGSFWAVGNGRASLKSLKD